MRPIRAIVIDDSAFMRKVISDILSSDERIDVIATGRNGKDGLAKVLEFSPDVVTLDVEMPIMDGMEALQEIMKEKPTPVVMLSSLTSEGAKLTIQAISNGAVDFVTKPSGSISLDIRNIEEKTINTVLTAANVKLKKKQPEPAQKPIEKRRNIRPFHDQQSIVAIGTSTGGPRALQNVLTKLPTQLNAPIVIVQHMPKGFTKSLAIRLNQLSDIKVKEAEHGDYLEKGTAYIAPGDYHMKVLPTGKRHVIELTKDVARKGHRPSVDVLFESVASLKNMNKLMVILTGMGNDGTEGLRQVKEHDAETVAIAEAEETCTVYGMPRAANESGNIDHVVPIHEVSQLIQKTLPASR